MSFRLESERLFLCEWVGDEADAFLPIAQDPRVMRFITGGEAWLHPQVREFIGRQMAYQSSLGYSLWKLVTRAEETLIGFCGLQPMADTDEVELGYWFAPSQWGKGLATEAAMRALEFAFSEQQIDHVVAVAMPANAASQRVMQHVGMHYVGDSQRRGFDVVKYAVSSSEFLDPRSRL